MAFSKHLHFIKQFEEIESHIPKDYDILFLGYHDTSIKYFYGQLSDWYQKADKVYGLFGYIVTNQGAQKLMDIFPITFQIDTEIPYNFDKINAYVVSPKKRIVFSDQSSIYTKFGTEIQVREHFGRCGIKWGGFVVVVVFLLLLLLV